MTQKEFSEHIPWLRRTSWDTRDLKDDGHCLSFIVSGQGYSGKVHILGKAGGPSTAVLSDGRILRAGSPEELSVALDRTICPDIAGA